MKIRSPMLVLPLLVAGWVDHVCAQATEREPFGAPPAAVESMASDRGAAFARLGSVLRARGEPGVALYWGEWLSREVRERRQQVIEGRVDARSSQSTDVYATYGGRRATSEANASSTAKVIAREETDRGDTSTALGRAGLWDVESAFVSEINRSGIKLVDASLAARFQGEAAAGEDDLRRLESAALLKQARFALELLGRGDTSSVTGWLFRVRLTEIGNGRRVLDFTTSGAPPAPGLQPFVATHRGFERASAPLPGPDAIGRQLAFEVAERLAQAL